MNKNIVSFLAGVVLTGLFVWFWQASRSKDTWEEKLDDNKNRAGAVFVLFDPNAEGTYESLESQSRYGDTKVVIYRKKEDAEKAVKRLKTQVQP